MGWTKTPSIDGYYWYTDNDVKTYTPQLVVRLENNGPMKKVFFLSGCNFFLGPSFPYNNFDPYFFGPIPPPKALGRGVVNTDSSCKNKERNYEPVGKNT